MLLSVTWTGSRLHHCCPLGARMARERSIAVHAAAAMRRVFSVGRQWQAVCTFLFPLARSGGVPAVALRWAVAKQPLCSGVRLQASAST